MKVKNRSVLRLAIAAITLSLASALHAQLSFSTTFLGSGAGNSTYTNATTAALNSLAANFSNSIALKVEVIINDLGEADTLGSSSANFALTGGYYHTTPLYNVKTSTDLGGTTTSITITMNINSGINWGYGASTPGSGNYSWQTVVMHEALHSMGFYDGIYDASGALADPGYNIFDSFVKNLSGTSFTSYATDSSGDAARAAAIINTTESLYWTGAFGVAANGGQNIKLYTPNPFESGSTYSHIDPSLTGIGGILFPSLLDNTYYAGPTAVELGIMRDMGWALTAVPEPSTYALIFGIGALMVVMVRRRRF